jgi:hypothetical protein
MRFRVRRARPQGPDPQCTARCLRRRVSQGNESRYLDSARGLLCQALHVPPPHPSGGMDAGFVPDPLCPNPLLLAKDQSSLLLPDTLIFCTLAAFGLFCFTLGGSARLARSVQAAGFLAAFGISVAHLIAYDFAFRVDGRNQLLAFIRQNVSPDATIAQDRRVGLPSRSDPRYVDSPDLLEQKIVSDLSVADVGSIDELRARGIRYVAVSEDEYKRFFLRSHKPSEIVTSEKDQPKSLQ